MQGSINGFTAGLPSFEKKRTMIRNERWQMRAESFAVQPQAGLVHNIHAHSQYLQHPLQYGAKNTELKVRHSLTVCTRMDDNL